MASVVETKERNKAYRRALRKLEGRVISLGQFWFPLGDLPKDGIRVILSSFEFSDGKPDFDLCFFRPLSYRPTYHAQGWFVTTKFPEYNRDRSELHGQTPVERALALCRYLCRYLSAYRSRRPDAKYTIFGDSGWCYTDEFKYGIRGLWEYGPLQIGVEDSEWIPQWYVEAIYHHRDTSFPHLKSAMISDIDGDNDTLFRGELLALIRTIRGSLAKKCFVDHTVHPVLLFSMMGTQYARILQGHFNGVELVIYRSKLYDFRHEDASLLEFFAQWFLSSPAGETKPS